MSRQLTTGVLGRKKGIDYGPLLFGYYKLDGDANDSSGKDNNGTLTGGEWVTETLPGIGSTTVLKIDTDGHYIELPSLQAADSKNFTYECWFKTEQTGANKWIIAEGSSTSNTPIVGLINENDRMRVYVRDDAGNSTGTISPSTYILNDGSWHHIALSFSDNDVVKGYFDGKEVIDASSTSIGTITTNKTTICALERSTVGLYAHGLISDVRIWNVARTETEINKTKDIRL